MKPRGTIVTIASSDTMTAVADHPMDGYINGTMTPTAMTPTSMNSRLSRYSQLRSLGSSVMEVASASAGTSQIVYAASHRT